MPPDFRGSSLCEDIKHVPVCFRTCAGPVCFFCGWRHIFCVCVAYLWGICTRDTFTGLSCGVVWTFTFFFSGLCEGIAFTPTHPARVCVCFRTCAGFVFLWVLWCCTFCVISLRPMTLRAGCRVGCIGLRLSVLVYVNALRLPSPIQRVSVCFQTCVGLAHGWRYIFLCGIHAPVTTCTGCMGPPPFLPGLWKHIAHTLMHPARVWVFFEPASAVFLLFMVC